MSTESPGAELPKPTCLFTGALLGPKTREEHTILRSLGGRVRSRRVTSSAFNEACGSYVDPYLLLPYAETMATLRPVLSAEHRGGELSVDVPGDNGTFVINENGELVLKGIKIIAKDPVTGRPTSFAGADTSKVIKMGEGLKKQGEKYEVSVVPMTDAPEWFRGRPVVCSEIEVAAIKCTLLTFDELLAGDPEHRFTRSLRLEPVRTFVRDAILSRKLDGEALHRFSLGMQYDRLGALGRLRTALDIPPEPLEHLLVASGNGATRTLDAVWWLLGIDPFGFRLSQTWDGGDFTCAVVNRTLKGGGFDGPIWSNEATSLCSPTDYRAFPDVIPTVARGQEIVSVISVYRSDGYRQAVDVVERTADEHVVGQLAESAFLGSSDGHSVVSAVRRRTGKTTWCAGCLANSSRPAVHSSFVECASQQTVSQSAWLVLHWHADDIAAFAAG